MDRAQITFRTGIALLAFAGNSLLCRAALKSTQIDPASFTAVRLISAAAMLALLLLISRRARPTLGNWPSAAALFVYASAFSLAYLDLTAGTGALLLFGAVQITMVSAGLIRGESFARLQLVGFGMACAGLVGLVLPGLTAPPLMSSALMILAGMAWGVYSLRGRGATDPLNVTAGNFLRTIPMTALFSLTLLSQMKWDSTGFVLAIASGAITSGLGYSIWYSVLPQLKATHAATLQLSVPVITAIAAIPLMGDQPSLRLLLAGLAILAGIWLVINRRTASR